MNLEKYLTDGVEKIVKDVVKSTLSNPKESIFISGFAKSTKQAADIRRKYENNGTHIPPFLIASITSQCNLHCAGCYARANHSCADGCIPNQLSDLQWKRIFDEAASIGISFILLAGGEPLVRKDVLLQAAKVKKTAFPVFTNGTMLDDEYCDFFSHNRNVIPMLSIEGDKCKTDKRRGNGVFDKLTNAMEKLNKNKVLFGASITVTTENIEEVTSDLFVNSLYKQGCRIIIYVEYVPVKSDSIALAPSDNERDFMVIQLAKLREKYDKMLFISFPGDEKSSGGCLAAGRGFFHINANGGAEPCPFSPYSDTNIKDISLIKAINSPLFEKLRSSACLDDEHKGGCVLFNKKDEVESFLRGVK